MPGLHVLQAVMQTHRGEVASVKSRAHVYMDVFQACARDVCRIQCWMVAQVQQQADLPALGGLVAEQARDCKAVLWLLGQVPGLDNFTAERGLAGDKTCWFHLFSVDRVVSPFLQTTATPL